MNIFGGQCGHKLTNVFKNVAIHVVLFILMVLLCNGLHYVLKRFSQPRITSDLFVGLFIGNLYFLTNWLDISVETIQHIIDFGMMLYMFVLGIEMDPLAFFRVPTREAKVAYAGILSTVILAGPTIPFINYSTKYKFEFSSSISTVLASTASPVLTRLLTSLKVEKSDIGRLVIAAGMHSDLVCTLILSIGYVAMPLPVYFNAETHQRGRLRISLEMGAALLIQSIVIATTSPYLFNWVNNENPDGRPMKVTHLVLSIAFIALMSGCSPACGYNPILSAFISGVCLPREGRVSRLVVSKVNYLLSALFYPIFFFWVGMEADVREFEYGELGSWSRLFLLIGLGTVGKVVGTALCGVILGFPWPESIAIGFLLSTKGHFHIYLASVAKECGISHTTSIGMLTAIIFTILFGPTVMIFIIKRARERAPTRQMALQTHDLKSELRIMLCIHGPQHVTTAINIMEISRGMPRPGILVYLTDIIEVKEKTEKSGQVGEENCSVHETQIVAMRDEITSTVQAYVDENGVGISLKRMLVSASANMARDICSLLEDLEISLIILPFNRNQKSDGSLDAGNGNFRQVNCKVLRNAPCSVGILIDKGLGSIGTISGSEIPCTVAVIFFGGKDDREALLYASRVSLHPGVKLTVLRFLLDANSSNVSKIPGIRSNSAEMEAEMRLDDECFAHFYERYVLGTRVSYMEKHLANSAETYSTLRSLAVDQYSLIIVGRGGRVNSLLTMGMNDWEQCPELGPVGDVLSGPHFSSNSSVLIIQQHNLKGELDGLDAGFSHHVND